jgi:acetyl coenzyme A synthetase (ADP forming)-like protein
MGELDRIFRPKSVALVGASNNPDKLGWFIMHNLLTYGFKGPVYPVNPKAKEVHSVKAYPSVTAIPDPVDLVVVVVPAKHTKKVFQECAKKGVKGLVVITAGFKEIGGEGENLEMEINRIANKAGMRFIGPNCMGIIHTHPDVTLDTTFGSTKAIPGKIAFMSQSGAMCVAILNHAKSELIGFSKFVSMGNKTNISGNDLLADFGEDPNTDIILMYIENFGNPRNLTPLAKEISMKKPIIAVKSGRTKAGALAATSHTGAIAGLDAAAEALFRQCGIMRATSIEELFDYAVALESQPLPKGKRVAVLTNAGGPGIMTADAIEGLELEMAHFSEETTERLRSFLPHEASVRNPVDMIAGATPEMYRLCLRAIIKDKNVDSIIVLNVPLVLKAEVETAQAIVDIGRFSSKPMLACFLGKKEDSPGVRYLTENNIPTYRFPESAVKALRMLFNYGQWRLKDKGTVKDFKVDKRKATALIKKVRRDGREWLDQKEVRELLRIYGFGFTKTYLARSEDEAVTLAKRLNFPVVLKVDSPDVIHKWDVGGVALDVHNERELRRAYKRMVENVTTKMKDVRINGIRVEEMVTRGKEVILGMTLDPVYGPLLMYGLGGIYVETFKDVSFRLVPLTDTDAREMIGETKGSALLAGARGEKVGDIPVLQEWLQRLAQLVNDHHEIAELDMNPVMVMPKGQGCQCVDARIRLTKEQ